MAKYFVLKCMPGLDAEHYRLQVGYPANDKRWEAGRLFAADNRRENLQPPPVPISIQTEPEDPQIPNVYAELYWNPIPLMTRRLVAALVAAGIDNLQTFDTVLDSPLGDNPPPPDHYLAVNIIGKVAAVDSAKSERSPESREKMISVDFYSLAVDESKAKDLLLFRLAENVTAVLVHEQIKAKVEERGIRTLTWLAPEDWAG